MNALKAIAAFLASGTGRRAGVFLLGYLTVVFHRHLGLDLEPNELFDVILGCMGYITQSAVRQAVSDHADAKVDVAQVGVDGQLAMVAAAKSAGSAP